MVPIRGQLLVSRTGDDRLPPCVRSKRPRVYVQNVPVCTGTARTCVSTCARFAGTHGDVLNVHTEAFWNPHTGFFHVFFFQRAATHTNTQTHTHTQTHKHQTHTTITTTHTTQYNTQHHTETETEREREREERRDKREDERQEERRSKTREETRWKRREKMKEKRKRK